MSSARSPSVAAPELPLNVAVTLRTVLRLGRGLRAAADAGADAARRWVADFVPPVVRAFFPSLLFTSDSFLGFSVRCWPARGR